MGDLIQFRSRSNHKADREFWVGGDSPIQDATHYSDSPLSEYVKSAGYPADEKESLKCP